jgi:hypothetical protein
VVGHLVDAHLVGPRADRGDEAVRGPPNYPSAECRLYAFARARGAPSRSEGADGASSGDTRRRTARESSDDLVDPGTFVESGRLAIAAQRARRDLTEHPSHGLVAGTARINGPVRSGCLRGPRLLRRASSATARRTLKCSEFAGIRLHPSATCPRDLRSSRDAGASARLRVRSSPSSAESVPASEFCSSDTAEFGGVQHRRAGPHACPRRPWGQSAGLRPRARIRVHSHTISGWR